MSLMTRMKASTQLQDEGKFLGYLLAALYVEGIDNARITREQLEDDMWTQVVVTRSEDYDSLDTIVRWRVRGYEPARKPKLIEAIQDGPIEGVFSRNTVFDQEQWTVAKHWKVILLASLTCLLVLIDIIKDIHP